MLINHSHIYSAMPVRPIVQCLSQTKVNLLQVITYSLNAAAAAYSTTRRTDFGAKAARSLNNGGSVFVAHRKLAACLSVRLSHADIESKLITVGSCDFHRR